LIVGRPQAKTQALSSSHGRQASHISRREGPEPEAGSCASAVPLAVQPSRGCHERSRSPSAAIETSDETTSTSQGPWKFEMTYCGTAKAAPATSAAGQTPHIPRSPAKAATTQKGTMSANTGSCRPTMAERAWRSRPVTPESAMIGVPSAPKATGAVFAISERLDAASGAKPSWIRSAAVTATGVPKPAAPSKKAPMQNAIPIT
jgi:hypothetical protein